MAERQSSVDLVRDSSVGGMCWEGTWVIQTGFELVGLGRACPAGALYLVDDVGVS